jgi:hypothetical protein
MTDRSALFPAVKDAQLLLTNVENSVAGLTEAAWKDAMFPDGLALAWQKVSGEAGVRHSVALPPVGALV